MLLGAHVSPAGGPANAVARGVERGCSAIQIFNQSPRAWKGRLYSQEEVAAYHEALAASPLGRATGIGGPKAQGAAATDADAVQSVRCARAAEHP